MYANVPGSPSCKKLLWRSCAASVPSFLRSPFHSFFFFLLVHSTHSLTEVSCPEDNQRRIFLLPALADSSFQQTSPKLPKRLPTDFYVNIHESHANYSSPLTSPAGQRSVFIAMFFFFPLRVTLVVGSERRRLKRRDHREQLARLKFH